MNGPEKDTALSVDVAAVFVGQRGRERERRAERDGPAQRNVRRLPGDVLPPQDTQDTQDIKTSRHQTNSNKGIQHEFKVTLKEMRFFDNHDAAEKRGIRWGKIRVTACLNEVHSMMVPLGR